jgi:hypothetical protein
MTGRRSGVPPIARIRSPLSIAGRQHDLKFIEFIPLSLGPLPLGNNQELLQAEAGGTGLRFIHDDIMASFEPDSTTSRPCLWQPAGHSKSDRRLEPEYHPAATP